MSNNKKDKNNEFNNDYFVPVLPELNEKSSNYKVVAQGDIINSLNTFTHKNIELALNGDKEVTSSKVTVILNNQLEKLDALTRMFIQIVNIWIKEYNITQNEFSMPLSKYMELRGIERNDLAKKQIDKIAKTLTSIKLTGREEYSKNKELINFSYLVPFYKIAVVNNTITIGTAPDIFNMFVNAPYISQQNTKLLNCNNLNIKINPHTWNLYEKIQALKNTNLGKQNEDIISVKTLVECTELPTIELVKAQRGSPRQKIIEPFLRDMFKLQDMGILKFNFCKSKGKLLTDKEIDEMESDYSSFINGLVKITWLEYPDMQKVIETKEKAKKRIAKAKQRKKKTTKK